MPVSICMICTWLSGTPLLLMTRTCSGFNGTETMLTVEVMACRLTELEAINWKVFVAPLVPGK